MERIAKFQFVSKEQFVKDWAASFGALLGSSEAYEQLKLPERATMGSAGYDFFCPCDITLAPGESVILPTGIRVEMTPGWVLQLYPRSGLGFKFRLQLDNTVGIIDSDYFYADNEGHIMARITNDSRSDRTAVLEKGKGFMQGVFLSYGITVDDDAKGSRSGGFGSTGK